MTKTRMLLHHEQVLSFDVGYGSSGAWRCRFLKLGGDPALTVYG